MLGSFGGAAIVVSLHKKGVLVSLLTPLKKRPDCKRPRWWTAARKAGATAVVAGVVAVSVAVAAPSRADPLILAPAVLEGAAEVAAGTAVAITPLGWVIIGGTAAAGLALLAYNTRDTWQPWLAGQFGQGNTSQQSQTPGTGNTAHVLAGFNLALATAPDQNTIRVNATWSAPAGSYMSAHVAYVSQCQYSAASQVATSTGGLLTTTSFTKLSNLSAPVNQNLDFRCAVSNNYGSWFGTPVSLKAGLAGTDGLPNLPTDGSMPTAGPANEVMSGTAKTGQFDPKDPATKYTASVECIDNYGTKSTITADSFGNQGAIKYPSCVAAGKGHGTGVMSVTGYPPGSAQGTVLYSTTFTPDSTKPLCDPSLASGGCTLSVSIDGKPCTVGDIQCENWIQIDANDSTHTRVSCNEGPYTAVLSACFLLERAYYPGGAPANAANTDGDPSTSSNLDPNGNQIPQTTPQTTATVPGGAGNPGPAGAAGGTTTDANQCWPSGWGVFNPLEWVYDPVVCAAKALFEPKTDVQTRITQMQGQFSNKIPITWFTAGGIANVSGGACPTDWALNISGQHISLICGTPADGIVRAFRPVLGAMLVIAAMWPLIRSLFYSAIPLFKVTPS